MKAILITILAVISLSSAIAQTAQKDLDVVGKYHIDKVIEKGKFHIWVTITNNSKSDYKDVVYKIEYFAADGTTEGSKDYTYHDYVGPGTSKKLKQQYLECPKDCKSVILSIVSANKLD